jgi:phage tail sheath gpL-like
MDPYGQMFAGSYVEPAQADQFTAPERNTVNTDGIATVVYRRGSAYVQRAAMLYQTNAGGTPDKACHDLVDVQNLMASLEEIEQIASRYVGWKLAPNGTQVPAGVRVMTPNAMMGLMLSWYAQRVPSRFVDYDGFKEELLAQINSLDQNRLDQILPIRLIPHLYVNAIQVGFIRGVPVL